MDTGGVRSLTRDPDLRMLTGITAFAAIIRFSTLDHQIYGHDEAVTALRVLQPGLSATMHVVVRSERSPPLYYLLAWAWSHLFGTGEVGLRSLSALFGTLTVPAAYLAARELASRRAGLLAAGFVALNPYLIWYSQEARSYALYVLFSAWALYFFARALRDRRSRSLALWALTSVLALCSHYFAIFLIVPEGLLLVKAIRPRRPAINAVASTAIVGLALLPLAYIQQSGGRADLFTSQTLTARAGQAALAFVASVEPGPGAGSAAVDHVQMTAGAIAGALLLVAIATVIRMGRSAERAAATRAGLIATMSFSLPLFLAIAGLDFVEPRKVLIGSLVPLLVFAAIAFGSVRVRRSGLTAAAACVALFVGVTASVYVSAQMERPNWRAAADTIGPATRSRILVVTSNGQDPLACYLHTKNFKPGHRLNHIRTSEIDTLGKSSAVSPPGAGFRLTNVQHVAGEFWLRRFRSPTPHAVSSAQVRSGRVLGEPSQALANAPSNPHFTVSRGQGWAASFAETVEEMSLLR
jgi:mannosyltransferase